METKHTPGPWRTGTPYATGGNQCRRVPIVGGDNWPDEEVIAVVGGGLVSPCDANARLIAAAPLLLEALQMAFDRDLTYLSDHAEIPRQDVVRAKLAIRAALGLQANPGGKPPRETRSA